MKPCTLLMTSRTWRRTIDFPRKTVSSHLHKKFFACAYVEISVLVWKTMSRLVREQCDPNIRLFHRGWNGTIVKCNHFAYQINDILRHQNSSDPIIPSVWIWNVGDVNIVMIHSSVDGIVNQWRRRRSKIVTTCLFFNSVSPKPCRIFFNSFSQTKLLWFSHQDRDIQLWHVADCRTPEKKATW